MRASVLSGAGQHRVYGVQAPGSTEAPVLRTEYKRLPAQQTPCEVAAADHGRDHLPAVEGERLPPT